MNYHVDKIKEKSDKEEYMATLGDPSMWIRNPQNTNRSDTTAPSHQGIAHIMQFAGINMIKANNDRINGWNLIRQYLDHSTELKPKIKVFSTCENLIRTLPSMIHDDRRPEDLDTKQEDHALDALRYGSYHIGKPPEIQETKPWVQREIDQGRFEQFIPEMAEKAGITPYEFQRSQKKVAWEETARKAYDAFNREMLKKGRATLDASASVRRQTVDTLTLKGDVSATRIKQVVGRKWNIDKIDISLQNNFKTYVELQRQEKELVGKGKKELYIGQMLVVKNGFGIFG